MPEPGMLAKVNEKLPIKITAPRVIGGVAVVGGLALAMPIIWTAAIGGAGLLALAAVGGAAILAMNAIPLVLQKWDNRILAARKSEARTNPIEQLQNYLRAKANQLSAFNKAVSMIGGQVKSLRDMIDDRKKAKPGYDATKQERALKAMSDAYAVLLEKSKAGEQALRALKEAIDDKQFEWNFAQAGQQAMQNLNATSGQELLDQMLADEAFSSVRDNFNRVFAELEVEAGRLNNAQQLTFGDETIDISGIKIPTNVGQQKLKVGGGSDFQHLEV